MRINIERNTGLKRKKGFEEGEEGFEEWFFIEELIFKGLILLKPIVFGGDILIILLEKGCWRRDQGEIFREIQ